MRIDCRRILAAVAAVAAACVTFAEAWNPVPLGEPGALKVETKLRNEPKLVDAIPARPEGIVLFDDTRAAVVATDFKNRITNSQSRNLKIGRAHV